MATSNPLYSRHRLTMRGPALSHGGRQALLERGYLDLRRLGSGRWCRQCRQELARCYGSEATSPPFPSHNDSYRWIRGVDRQSDFFFDLARKPRILSLVSLLLNKEVIPLSVDCFIGSRSNVQRTTAHQTHVRYQEHFDDEMALSIWICVQGRQRLEFARWSPLKLLPHTALDAEDSELDDAAGYEFHGLCLNEGDSVAFHSYAIHRNDSPAGVVPALSAVLNYRGSPFRTRIKDARRA